MFRLNNGRMTSRRVIKSEAPFYNGPLLEYDAGSYLSFSRRGNVFSTYFSADFTIPLSDVTSEFNSECMLCDSGCVGLPPLRYDMITSFIRAEYVPTTDDESSDDEFSGEDPSFHDDLSESEPEEELPPRESEIVDELAESLAGVTLEPPVSRSVSLTSELVKFLFRGIKNFTYSNRTELDIHIVQWHEYEDHTTLYGLDIPWLNGTCPRHFVLYVMADAHFVATNILSMGGLIVDISRDTLEEEDIKGCLLYASVITDRLEHLNPELPTVFVVPSNFKTFRALCPQLPLHSALALRHTLWMKQQASHRKIIVEDLEDLYEELRTSNLY